MEGAEKAKVRNPKRAGRKTKEESELKVPKSFKFHPKLCEILAKESEKCGQYETDIVEEALIRDFERRGYVITHNGYVIKKMSEKTRTTAREEGE
jgi:hypothetical protein